MYAVVMKAVANSLSVKDIGSAALSARRLRTNLCKRKSGNRATTSDGSRSLPMLNESVFSDELCSKPLTSLTKDQVPGTRPRFHP